VRILFVSPRQCWPVRSGAKLREFHLARALGLRHQLTFVYFASETPMPTAADLPFAEQVIAVPKPAAYGPLQLAQGLLTRWPLPILNYSSPALDDQIRRLTSQHSYDLIHFDSIHMIRCRELLDAQRQGRIIYNWHNIESEYMARFAETVQSPARAFYARQTTSKMAALESDILRTGFGHVVCSQRELDQLHAQAPRARIKVVDNGVDVAAFAGVRQAASQTQDGPPRFVFIGAMDYFPNTDAATSFATNIWPILRAALPPGSHLQLVGAAPPPSVVALGQMEGVTVTGTVPDIKPYYEGATAALVPLRTGGGTRLKILEAMAAGVPVISTPLGAEGLAVTEGRDILLADAADPQAWIRQATSLLASPARRRELSQSGLDLVQSRYDWDILGRTLAETYESWVA
jgi:polysaccharide biosynthesis protein PslH